MKLSKSGQTLQDEESWGPRRSTEVKKSNSRLISGTHRVSNVPPGITYKHQFKNVLYLELSMPPTNKRQKLKS